MHCRIGMAKLTFRELGRGSSRLVFELGEYVLKVAYNRAGITQNKHEADPKFIHYYRDLLASVVASDPKGYWLIQQKATAVSERELTGDEWCRFQARVTVFARVFDLPVVECTEARNLGRLGGRFCLIDYGLSAAIGQMYYASRSGGRTPLCHVSGRMCCKYEHNKVYYCVYKMR